MPRSGLFAIRMVVFGGFIAGLCAIPAAKAGEGGFGIGPADTEVGHPVTTRQDDIVAPERAEPEASVAPRYAPGRKGTGWTLIVSPYVWGASLGGDLGLAGLQTPAHLPFRDIFKHLDLAAMGNIEVVNDRWGGYLDAQHVRTSQTEKLLSVPVDLRIRTTRVAGGFYYKAWVVPLSGDTAFDARRTISFEPTVGLRWTRLKAGAAVAPLGLETDRRAGWVDPFAGLRVNADLSRHWNLFVQGDVGGFGAGTDVSVNALAMLGYRTHLLGQRTILRGGYRFIYEDYSQDDFTGRGRFVWDMQQRGPVLGLSMPF